jgi:hypothetical protein
MASWSGASRQVYLEHQAKLVATSWLGHLVCKPRSWNRLVNRDAELSTVSRMTLVEQNSWNMRLKPQDGVHGFYFLTVTAHWESPFDENSFMLLSLADIDCRVSGKYLTTLRKVRP